MDNLSPAVEIFNFPEDLAKDLVNMFDTDERVTWNRSLVGQGQQNEVRTSDQFNFEHEMPIAAGKVKDIFITCVQEYMDKYNIMITQDEGLILLKYDEFKKYDFHADSDWSMYRTLSGIIYLNPQEYEGGETYFKFFDLNIKPEKPSIVLFPSNYAYLHSAMPVTYGTKYIFVTWMNDMPPGFNPRILSTLAHITGK